MRVDEQKPDIRRQYRTSGQLTAKSISIKGAKRRFGDCARKVTELTPGDLLRVASARHLSRKLCSSLRRSYSFGQRFSFLGESLAEKSFDSNPAVGPVVSDSTGLDFFLGCPFFPFVGRVPRLHRIISRQDRLGATILHSVDPQRPPL